MNHQRGGEDGEYVCVLGEGGSLILVSSGIPLYLVAFLIPQVCVFHIYGPYVIYTSDLD